MDLKAAIRAPLRAAGFDVHRYPPPPKAPWPDDFTAEEIELYRLVRPYTMTSPEAVSVLASAVRYLVNARIPGAIVECGVWRGGSMMTVAKTLRDLDEERELFLFDTFEGMPEPGDRDRLHKTGEAAAEILREEGSRGEVVRAQASLEEVRAAVLSVGYTPHRVHFVSGMVEETVPGRAPTEIALLRLDTDWYSSTRHELVHLFPRLAVGGVLIIDDYGWWRGAREAMDEYLAETDWRLWLVRIDSEGRRVSIKLPSPDASIDV